VNNRAKGNKKAGFLRNLVIGNAFGKNGETEVIHKMMWGKFNVPQNMVAIKQKLLTIGGQTP